VAQRFCIFCKRAQPLFQFGTVALDPAPDRRVVRLQTALGDQLFDIAERERVPKIPAHGANNQFRLRLQPLEDRRSDCLLHDLFRLPAAARQSCNTSKGLSCANRECPLLGKATGGRIVRHGFYRTKWGRRRRYRCGACGKTFCTTTETPYHRLQHRRATFDEVAALSVEGLNKSAIARVKRIAWNTVDSWLSRAAESCQRFNDRNITGLAV